MLARARDPGRVRPRRPAPRRGVPGAVGPSGRVPVPAVSRTFGSAGPGAADGASTLRPLVSALWRQWGRPSGGAVSTRSATGARARLGRAGRGRQVLLEDVTRRAIAEAAPRGVVEPVGEPAEGGAGERLGRARSWAFRGK